MMEKIDFVITWVDGTDPEWLADKERWEQVSIGRVSRSEEANAECRYRPDCETLRYWFRAVEECAPWVNKVHLITCGQKPYWLNENHPKLNLVDHKDFIPEQYLPTFNSRSIELNLHRLKELAEHFVIFNDDVYLLQPIEPTFFFRRGNPVLTTDLRYPPYFGANNWSRAAFNDYCLVNKRFDIRKQIWSNREKWFNISALGLKRVRQNLMCYFANKTLPIGTYAHLSHPQLKSTLDEMWELEGDVLDATCKHRFRSDEQVNIYLLSAWNQAKGNFYPAHEKSRGVFFVICSQNMDGILAALTLRQFPQVCLNDFPMNEKPEECQRAIVTAFQSVFPNKSSFENR